MESANTIEYRKSLKAKLKWGDMTKIAKLAEVDLMTVDRWFKNKTNNAAIEPAANALLEARSKKMQEALKNII
ncbi:hypothetical protein [Leeuwenhoekiella sp. ZYFB001]|uniref:hypothetical protein n=1 Tax=Leeuwenhoekiella sp. ZYFB001 TaxID=2719912 RepID=UPI0014306B4D|nr:hypothetical protein [Leeuwenhoekiella sp. ZYFB001]